MGVASLDSGGGSRDSEALSWGQNLLDFVMIWL